MFKKPLSLKVAGILGILGGMFYLFFAMDLSTQILQVNPYAEQDWKTLIDDAANNAGPLILTQLTAFLATMLLAIFFAAVAVQAAKTHPTLASLGGIFMGAAAGMLGLRALWIAFVQIPMAITYRGATDQAFREMLLSQYRVGIFNSVFFAWCYILLMAVGLFLMTGALLPVKAMAHTLPVAFGLAAVACAAFVPALAYIGNKIFMSRIFEKELASSFFFAVWFLPGLAFAEAGAWLWREGDRQEMPEETISQLHLENNA